MDFGQIPESERLGMIRLIEEKQAKQFINLFAYVVDHCFDDCIQDFTSKALSEKETTCTKNCTDKVLKLTNRIGQRMSEKQMNPGAGSQ